MNACTTFRTHSHRLTVLVFFSVDGFVCMVACFYSIDSHVSNRILEHNVSRSLKHMLTVPVCWEKRPMVLYEYTLRLVELP